MGPRPALPNEVATYNDYQRQRLLVKPGMTCYWQTRRNRDSITFDEWVDLDLWWRGECGHVYQMAVRDRVRARPGYCPYCSGRKRPERPIRLD